MRFVIFCRPVAGMAVALAATSCSSSDSSSGSSASTGGGACDFTDPTCTAVKSDCLALADNGGKTTFAFRMAQLKIQKPAGLQVAQLVIDPGITMSLPACRLTGTGLFSWLLQFDTTKGELLTGGANPVMDPTQGYCFINGTVGGKMITPITLKAPIQNGMFSVMQGQPIVYVPIFAVGQAPIVLPLRQVRIIGGQISADQNCIGKYNLDEALPQNNCIPNNDPFTNAGTVDGFISLEEADAVPIPPLGGNSLCYVLTKQTGTSKTCPRDSGGALTVKGDWCAATNMPATSSCADAYKLSADFAASAVKVTGDSCPPMPPK